MRWLAGAVEDHAAGFGLWIWLCFGFALALLLRRRVGVIGEKKHATPGGFLTNQRPRPPRDKRARPTSGAEEQGKKRGGKQRASPKNEIKTGDAKTQGRGDWTTDPDFFLKSSLQKIFFFR